MLRLVVLLCCSLAINAQLEEAHPAPEPYSFAYSSPNEDGSSSSREETGDANGRVTGFYVTLGLDGQQRRVDYVADENGFRTSVKTNEIGTESQNAADAEYLSSAPTAAELVAQYEASGAGRARIQAQGQRAIIGARLNGAIVSPGLRGVSGVRQVLATQAGLNGGLVAGPVVGSAGVLRTQTLGLNGGLVAGPVLGSAGVLRTQTLGLNGGLVAGPVVGSAGVLRAQTLGLNRGIGLVGPLSGGISRFQSVTSGGGSGLVGVAPVGGLQSINTIRATGGLGLNGIGIAGLSPGAGLQTIQTTRLQGLGLQGGVQGLGLQGLALNRLQGLQGVGIQGGDGYLLIPVSSLGSADDSVIRLLQGLQGLRLIPQGGYFDTFKKSK